MLTLYAYPIAALEKLIESNRARREEIEKLASDLKGMLK